MREPAFSRPTDLTFPTVFLAACSIALSACLVVHLLGLSGRGIDLTDEGYYLNWIANPWAFSADASQFGFVYHPLYLLLNGDVAALRQASLIVNFVAAWLLVFHAIRPKGQSEGDWKGTLVRTAVACAVGTLTFLLYRLWLPTPNYNSLALLSVLVFAGGVLVTRSTDGRKRFAGWHIMSFAVFLAFAAKPTTAAVLAILAAAYGVSSRRFKVVELLSASIFFLVLFSIFAWASYGGPLQLLAGLLDSASAAVLLTQSYTVAGVLRVDPVSLAPKEVLAFCAAVMMLVLSVIAYRTRFGIAVMGISTAILLGLGAAQMLSDSPLYFVQSAQFGLLLLAVPVAALLILTIPAFLPQQQPVLATVDWHTAVLFMFLPLAFILGSGNNYWTGAIGAGLFWVLAGLIMLNRSQTSLGRLLPASAYAQALTIFIIAVAVNAPYRQQEPLASQHAEFAYGSGHSLLLAADVQRYLTDLRAAATRNGFRPGDDMIDLTGHNPGALFAVGAQSLGRAWIIGGYPGSRDLAVRMLGTVPCEKLVQAWVLLEEGGPREISVAVLNDFGLDASRDYDRVEPIISAALDGNPSVSQVLLRPRPDNIKICK